MLTVLASFGLAATLVLAYLGANVKEVFPSTEVRHYRSLGDISTFALPYAAGRPADDLHRPDAHLARDPAGGLTRRPGRG